MASKTKNMCQRLGNLGAMFSERSFPHFKTYSMQMNHCYYLTQHFKTFDSNKCLQGSLSKMQGP